MPLNPELVPSFRTKVKIRKESFGYLMFVRGLAPISINEDGKGIVDLIDGKRSILEIASLIFHQQQPEGSTVSFIVSRVIEFLEFAVKTGAIQVGTENKS